jgi:multidrug resistance efflux pump
MNLKDLLKDAYKEGMTLEEIETALESIELPTDYSAEVERLKNALSKSNSEASEFKKQLKEKMSANELKEKEEAEAREKLQSDYDNLLKKVTVSENKAKFLSMGYDDALATETAEALANGEMDKVFANQKKHLENNYTKV